MRARAEWRDHHICPLCGFPREVCQAPETEWALEDPARVRCHITTRLRAAQSAYSKEPTGSPEGLLWETRFKPDAISAQ